jgi:hypothetical protein
MFGFGKKKPKTALDEFIFAVYGNPPPPKRANVDQAVELACDQLLLGLVDREAVRENVSALAATPIPYSTHDLAISATLNFFKDPRYIPLLGTAQLAARIQAITWTKEGLVVAALMKSFEDTLYKLYKPAPPARLSPPSPPRPMPAPDDQRYDLVRRLIHHRLSSTPEPGIATPSLEQLEHDLPVEVLKQTCEFSILLLVEQFHQVLKTCSDHASAVQKLNELHSDHFSLAGISLPIMSAPFTFPRYVRHYLDNTFSYGEPMSDEFIGDAIDMIDLFYAGFI